MPQNRTQTEPLVPRHRRYPSDTTDGEWKLLQPFVAPDDDGPGAPRTIETRAVVDALRYRLRTGCQWRQLPRDFPNWKTVYTVFWRWRTSGLWQRIHDALRRQLRRREGKRSEPTAVILDSQSIRTAEGGEQRGYDAGKKITGRKRHLAVDTLGLVWAVVVHSATWQDHEGAHFVLAQLSRQCRRVKVLFADSAYARQGLPDWVYATFGWVLQTILRPVAAQGFVVLPKRWIVERTFSWLARHRRHARDYERNTDTSEAMIYIAMISLMSRRLARKR